MGQTCLGAQQISWHCVLESAKNIPLLFTCKNRTSCDFLLYQGLSGEKSWCKCIKQKHDLACHFVCPCCQGLSGVSPGGREQLESLLLSPTSQTHHHAAAAIQGKLPSSTLLLQLKMSFAGAVSALLYFMLKSYTGKGQDQTAHYISSLSTVSKLSTKISVIS